MLFNINGGKKMNMRFFGMTFGVSAALILTGCGNGEAIENGSNESISEQLNYTITGIEPGAGGSN
jgi:glycine betaine/proline transport system substrate-binding protein